MLFLKASGQCWGLEHFCRKLCSSVLVNDLQCMLLDLPLLLYCSWLLISGDSVHGSLAPRYESHGRVCGAKLNCQEAKQGTVPEGKEPTSCMQGVVASMTSEPLLSVKLPEMPLSALCLAVLQWASDLTESANQHQGKRTTWLSPLEVVSMSKISETTLWQRRPHITCALILSQEPCGAQGGAVD